MQKSFTLLVAGILATSGINALKLEDNRETSLAQTTSHRSSHYRHHGYHGNCDYDCIEEKVTSTLSAMINENETHKDECLAEADDIR